MIPEISKEAAIDLARKFLSHNEVPMGPGAGISGELFYKEFGEDNSLAPWWIIEVPTGSSGNRDDYINLMVDPVGNVSNAEAARNAPVVVCNGSTQASTSCANTNDNPTIIYSNGSCNTTYTCPPSATYQTAYDEAIEVQQMFNDVTGVSVNVGTANADNGGTVDINVGGNTGGNLGRTSTSTTGATATIIVPSTYSPSTIDHEMGHLGHAAYSYETWVLTAAGLPAIVVAEHDAVFEYLAEVTKIIMNQYNGHLSTPLLNPTVTWSNWNINYSVQFVYDDMSTSVDEYFNARIGGHAFYELVNEVGIELAAKAFFLSFPKLTDINANGALSWQEARQAMLEAAADIGNSTLTAAVKDAWFDVDVGESSAGEQNPPTDSQQNSPNPPSPFAEFQYCDASDRAIYDLYHWSPGAYDYLLWYSHNGSGFHTFAAVSSTPTALYVLDDVEVKVSACNNAGCSAVSSAVSLPYVCF